METYKSNPFIFSSWMLLDSFHYCTECEDEGAHLIAGIDIEGIDNFSTGIGTRLITFPYADKSIAHAQGLHHSTQKITIDAYEGSHRILALIHSHPGNGTWSNYPSLTDLNTQRLWEYTTRMIGGIWSRDGYLRFFSYQMPFKVYIEGSHLEKVSKYVYKLKEQYLIATSLQQNQLAM